MFLDASVSYFSFLLCCHNSDFLNACPQNETWYFKLVMTLSSPFHIVKFLMQLQISSETCSRQRNQRSSFQHPLDHRKSKRVPEKHLLLLYWLHQNLWLCGSKKKKLWKIHKEMGIPDHFTCLLRNLYVSQEATVRTRHGTTDWLQIGKGVHQMLYIITLLI